jgi:hypothetical protein
MGALYKILGVVYLIVGLYVLNESFGLITMPGFVESIRWLLLLIGAVIIFIAAIKNILKRAYPSIPGI